MLTDYMWQWMVITNNSLYLPRGPRMRRTYRLPHKAHEGRARGCPSSLGHRYLMVLLTFARSCPPLKRKKP